MSKDQPDWFARIKWYDGKVETVPIVKVRKFSPKSLDDFDKNKWYRVKGSSKDYSDGKDHSAFALIGGIAESCDAFDNMTTRIKFSSVRPPTCDPESTESEQDRLAHLQNQAVKAQQSTAANIKKTKQKAHSDSFKTFLNSQMSVKPSALEERCKDAKNKSNSQTDNASEVNSLKRQLQEMKEQLANERKRKCNENELIRQVQDRLKEDMKECIQSEVKKIKEEVQDSLKLYIQEVSEFKKSTAALQDMLSKSDIIESKVRIQQWVDALNTTS